MNDKRRIAMLITWLRYYQNSSIETAVLGLHEKTSAKPSLDGDRPSRPMAGYAACPIMRTGEDYRLLLGERIDTDGCFSRDVQ